jgi:hypothetical protein
MRKLAVLIVVLLMVSMTFSVSSAAAPAPDPACTGSLTRMLSADPAAVTVNHGFITSIFSTLRYTPDGGVKKVMFSPNEFVVVDPVAEPGLFAGGLTQPTCKTNVLFWYIRYPATGDEGWASESQVASIFGSNQYWLTAGDPVTTPPTACPGGPAFALTAGGQGQIAQVFSTLRVTPGGSGVRVNAPATFTVAAAAAVPAGYTQPTCRNGLAFWYVDYGGTIGAGWASEGAGSTRWLIPYP